MSRYTAPMKQAPLNWRFLAQLAVLLAIIVVAILALVFFLGLIADFRADTRNVDVGDKLQAVANLIGSALGAVLSGALAAGAALWVLGRESAERERRARSEDEKARAAVQATEAALVNWLSSTTSIIILSLDTVANCAIKSIPSDQVAAVMHVNAGKLRAAGAAPELRQRISAHLPDALLYLSEIEAQLPKFADALCAGLIKVPATMNNALGAVLDPKPDWAFGAAYSAKPLYYSFENIREICVSRSEIISGIWSEIDRRISNIDRWARANGARVYDFSAILPQVSHDLPSTGPS